MRLTQQQLEAHLWGADNILRGKTAGKDCKNYILSRRVNIMKMADLISEQGLRSEGPPMENSWILTFTDN